MDLVILFSLIILIVISVFLFIKLNNHNNNTQDTSLLLQLNDQLKAEIEKIRESVEKNSGENRKEIQGKLDNITQGISDFQKHTSQSLQKQFADSSKIITKVTEKLKGLESTNEQVLNFAEQMRSLEKILGNQKQRGILGEIQLENLLANVLPPELYKMQYKFSDGETVDAVVFYKNFIVPIDAKFSLDNYNRMIENNDSNNLKDLEKSFKEDIKKRIDETSKYIRPNEKTLDYAFMFIPADGMYQDLLNSKVGSLQINAKDLVSYAYTKKVMIVSPMSLFPYLQTTLKALNELKIEESIKVVIDNIGKLKNHLNAYEDSFNRLGKTLGTAVNHYNNASKEFKKIDKDVLKISNGKHQLDYEMIQLEKPSDET